MLWEGELGAFDLDHCRDPHSGEISPWASDLVARCASYTEVTPSQTGLRIIGVVSGDQVHRKLKMPGGGAVECYRACQRYITVTGDQLEGTPQEMNDIDDVMDAVVEELGGAGAANPKSNQEQCRWRRQDIWQDLRAAALTDHQAVHRERGCQQAPRRLPQQERADVCLHDRLPAGQGDQRGDHCCLPG